MVSLLFIAGYLLVGMLAVFVITLHDGKPTSDSDKEASSMIVFVWPFFFVLLVGWVIVQLPISLAAKIREWVRR